MKHTKKKLRISSIPLRLAAIAMSLVMLFALFPYSSFAATEEQIAAGKDLMKMFDSNTPSEFNSPVNPYGYAMNQVFMMAPQNELLVYKTFNQNSGDKVSNVRWYRGFSPGGFSGNTASARMYEMYDTGKGPYNDYGSLNMKDNLAFVQAVAFDALGTGHKDHVAYVGLRISDGKIVTFVMNTNTGATSVNYELGGGAYLRNKDFEQYEATNLFAITAGKYNADPNTGETFVIYVPGNFGECKLMEYKVTSSNSSGVSMSQVGTTQDYLHEAFLKTDDWGIRQGVAGALFDSSPYAQDKLQVALATGDVNGDQIDDLVVVSHYTQLTGDFVSAHPKYYAPQMKVAKGSVDSKTILDKPNGNGMKDKLLRKSISGGYMSMFAPDVSVGDVNGDGIDEIVVAGWMRATEGKDSGKVTTRQLLLPGVTVGIFGFTGGYINTISFEQYDDLDVDRPILNVWSQAVVENFILFYTLGSSFDGTACPLIPKYQVECVALDGDSNQEYIFLNGTFCTFSESGQLNQRYTPDVFQRTVDNGADFDADFGFLESAAVGAFDGNKVGREQITVSMGLSAAGDDDDYHYFLGTMGGREYKDTVKDGVTVKYGKLGKYYTTGFYHEPGAVKEMKDNDKYYLYDKGANYDEGLNCVVVAIDRGNDGIVARYIDKEWSFSNPNVLTVLQAAPYFGNLPAYGDNATTYAFTTSHTIGNQSADSTSFSVGASFEAEGPGIKFSIGGGYTKSWSKSFEESFTESHTTTFTAKNENQVVLQRTPLIMYKYAIQDDDGQWKDKDGNWLKTIEVIVPGTPSYALMTVEEYNAFARAYNRQIKDGRYVEITDSTLLENEGDPTKYYDAWGSGRTKLSASNYSANATTGAITSTYEKGSEDKTTITTSQGYYVDLFLGTGVSFGAGSVYGGAESSVNGEKSLGKFTASAENRAVSGTVYGLGGLKGTMDDALLSQYGFTWSFGTWNISMGDDLNIPVYGYVVTDVNQALLGPTNFKVDPDEDPEVMDVSFNSVPGANEYRIYMRNDNGQWEQIHTYTPNTPDSMFFGFGLKFPEDCRANAITLAATAIVDGRESAMSNMATFYKNATALSAYEIAVQNGFKGTQAQWLASLVGPAGEAGADGADGVGIDKVYIDAVTGELMVQLTDGKDAMNLGVVVGENGVDGVSVESLYVDETTGNLMVKLSNSDTPVDLGSVKGEKGDPGQDGVGIESVTIEEATGNLLVKLTDGSDPINLGTVVGADGADGVGIDNLYIDQTTGQLMVKLSDSDAAVSLGVVVGTDGADGAGIESIYIDETTGSLMVKLSNNDQPVSLGAVKGEKGDKGDTGETGAQGEKGETGQTGAQGEKGDTGRSGADGKDGRDGKDGKDGIDGKDGAPGRDGKDGANGAGIQDIVINENGEFVFTLTDGSTINAGKVPEDPQTKTADMQLRLLATIAIILAAACLLWNGIALIVSVTKKRS